MKRPIDYWCLWLIVLTTAAVLTSNLFGQRWANQVIADFARSATDTLERHERCINHLYNPTSEQD